MTYDLWPTCMTYDLWPTCMTNTNKTISHNCSTNGMIWTMRRQLWSLAYLIKVHVLILHLCVSLVVFDSHSVSYCDAPVFPPNTGTGIFIDQSGTWCTLRAMLAKYTGTRIGGFVDLWLKTTSWCGYRCSDVISSSLSEDSKQRTNLELWWRDVQSVNYLLYLQVSIWKHDFFLPAMRHDDE